MQTLPKMFVCLAKLERAVYELYHTISLRATNDEVSWIMEFIALDSWKHNLLYMEMAGRLTNERDLRVEDADCKDLLGNLFIDSLKEQIGMKERIEAKTSLSNDEVKKLLDKLGEVEKVASEEVFVGTVVNILKMSPEVKDKNGLKKILEFIAEDEERHENLLKLVEEITIK